MFIIGQTGEIIVNTDHVECIFVQPERGVPAIKARTRSVNVTLGLYKTKEAIDRAMAHLGLALLGADAGHMRAFAMPDDPPEEIPAAESIHQMAGTDPEGGDEHGEVESNVPAAGGA